MANCDCKYAVSLIRGRIRTKPKSLFYKINQDRGITIEQCPEGQSIAMFKDPAVKPLIESAGHIYDSTVISSYF